MCQAFSPKMFALQTSSKITYCNTALSEELHTLFRKRSTVPIRFIIIVIIIDNTNIHDDDERTGGGGGVGGDDIDYDEVEIAFPRHSLSSLSLHDANHAACLAVARAPRKYEYSSSRKI